MPTTDFQPISFNGEPLTNDKLNQMCNNEQYLFDRATKIRYSVNGLIRETGLKVLAGKTPFPARRDANFIYVNVSFGNFFTAGCHPVVTATVEATSGSLHRSKVVLQKQGSSDIDNAGFVAVVTGDTYAYLAVGGWVHWTAVGF